jgi:enoyl-CoA hydratase
MCRAIDAALIDWADDGAVALVVIDAEGARAFCAGGDIAQMYATGTAGDYAYGRRFWRDEYRMNARISGYPKPVVALMQGFTMGGGVGIGCHAAHRVVGESSLMAMPECGIGLVPDVGGSLLLARSPGGMGAWLGLTGARMGPGDALHAGFADHFLPEAEWPALIAELEGEGDAGAVAARAKAAPESLLSGDEGTVGAAFAAGSVEAILAALEEEPGERAEAARRAMHRNSPLSMACTLAMIRGYGPDTDVRSALKTEYRFTHRSMEHGDFLEGIRAAIIDKDRTPRWRHQAPEAVSAGEVAAMLAPLGEAMS